MKPFTALLVLPNEGMADCRDMVDLVALLVSSHVRLSYPSFCGLHWQHATLTVMHCCQSHVSGQPA